VAKVEDQRMSQWVSSQEVSFLVHKRKEFLIEIIGGMESLMDLGALFRRTRHFEKGAGDHDLVVIVYD